MANKLRDVFNKDEHFLKGTIRFKDVSSSIQFKNALESVYKEGKSVQVSGVESMSVSVDSGSGSFPIEQTDVVSDIIIGPSPEEVKLTLDIDGEQFEFPVVLYHFQNGGRVNTKDVFPFSTTLEFDETSSMAKVNIKPSFDKADSVETILKSIKIEVALLKKFFSVDLEKGTDLNIALEHFNRLYRIFDKVHFVEMTFGKSFVPVKIDLDDGESIKDLVELCLLIRDKKVIRNDIKMNDSVGKGLKLASNEDVIIGKNIAMTFIWQLEYSIWGEKIKLYCTNLLHNAIVKEIEDLEDGQIRIVYGESDDKPMYVTYRGFINEEDAGREHDETMNKRYEYENAKTVIEYIEEGY